MVMAKDTDEVKDPNGGEDEDRPDFIFDQELLGEKGEAEEKETFGEKTEPHLELEKDLNRDEGLDGLVSEGDIGGLRDPRVEEPGEKETQDKEEAGEEVLTEMPPAEEVAEEEEGVPAISEEKIEALLTKLVSDVLERVAREVIPEVAEKVISEEIDALKKIITSQD